MKILHVAPIGHAAEGIGTVLENLTVEQKKLGHEVRIISKYDNIIYCNLDIVTIKQIATFREFINEWSPNIVVFHSIYEKEYLSFSKELLKRWIPYLVQMHGGLSVEHYKKNHLKKWIANILFWNKFIKKSSCILYLNHAEYNNCVIKDLNPNFAFLPNGCNIPIIEEFEKHNRDFIDFVFIGRIIINHKGLDVLADAIRILKNKKIENVRFSFYGNEIDPDVPILKKMLEDFNGYASFYGGIYGDAKIKRLKNCDVFFLTSRYEGMPMGILEALSYGIPCLVTPGTNMAEDIASYQAGWVSDFSPKEIAKTIIKASSDLKTNPQFYRKKAFLLSQKFSWTEIAKESIKIYSKYKYLQ